MRRVAQAALLGVFAGAALASSSARPTRAAGHRTDRSTTTLSAIVVPASLSALASTTSNPGLAASASHPTESRASRSSTRKAAAPCTCATAKDMNGWCERHGFGYVASVKIKSRLLYDTMDAHGHTLDLSIFECGACQKAIASDGFCEEHRIGFLRKQAYFSRLTYELARGELRKPARIVCPVCRKNARGQGWCETCQTGMIGKTAIKGAASYQHVSKAIGILRLANKAAERCQDCALAIVTDAQCPMCRITYKDGHPVPAR